MNKNVFLVLGCLLMLLVSLAVAQEMCEVDSNYDHKVDLTDLVKMKEQFNRNDCPDAPAMVPKTGMVTNWFPGDDGSTQCGMAPPSPRFTNNVDKNKDGDCIDVGETCNGTVTDKLTGLIWLKDAGCFTEMQTCSQLMVDCNSLNSGECGLSDGSIEGDWRLPTIRELLSVVDFGKNTPPAAPTGMFTNIADCDGYCNSTPYGFDKDYAVIINLYNGDVYRTIGSANLGALCVKTTYPYCPSTVTTVFTTSTTAPTSSTTTIPLGGACTSHIQCGESFCCCATACYGNAIDCSCNQAVDCYGQIPVSPMLCEEGWVSLSCDTTLCGP